MSNDQYDSERFNSGVATVGRFCEKDGSNSIGKPIKVQIICGDGNFPPHIRISRENDDLRACVRLDMPEYFLRDGFTSMLTDGQIKGLIDFFKSPSDFPVVRIDGTTYKLQTMWDYTIVAWNREKDNARSRFRLRSNGDGYLVSPKMPDYSKLNMVDINKTICGGVNPYELACVDKKDTGLKYDLMIDSLGKDRRSVPPHVFVCAGDELIPVLLSSDSAAPCDVDLEGFDAVRKYVRAYMPVFCAHYNKLLTDRQALNLLARIEEASESVNLMLRKIGSIK